MNRLVLVLLCLAAPTPALAASETATVTSTASRTATATRTSTVTLTETSTTTDTRTATATRTATVTPTATHSATATATATVTGTSTSSRTATASRTSTATRTDTKTLTHTSTATRTSSATSSSTRTFTRTSTATRTQSLTPTITTTRSPTPIGWRLTDLSIQEAVNIEARLDQAWESGTPRAITGGGSFVFVAPVQTSTQTTGQANCNTTADLVFLYDSTIEDGSITHTGLNAAGTPTSDGVFLGSDALVTTSSGQFLAAGSSIPLGRSAANQWYGITLSGDVKLTFLRVPRQ